MLSSDLGEVAAAVVRRSGCRPSGSADRRRRRAPQSCGAPRAATGRAASPRRRRGTPRRSDRETRRRRPSARSRSRAPPAARRGSGRGRRAAARRTPRAGVGAGATSSSGIVPATAAPTARAISRFPPTSSGEQRRCDAEQRDVEQHLADAAREARLADHARIEPATKGSCASSAVEGPMLRQPLVLEHGAPTARRAGRHHASRGGDRTERSGRRHARWTETASPAGEDAGRRSEQGDQGDHVAQARQVVEDRRDRRVAGGLQVVGEARPDAGRHEAPGDAAVLRRCPRDGRRTGPAS